MASLFQTHIDLGDNETREIDNPLAHIEDLDTLDADARRFAERVNPEAPEYVLWVKAARIARDPLGISKDSVPGLTDQEEILLARERSRGFWHQPKTLHITAATLCLAAIVQGWTQSAGNGSNQSWPEQFGINIDRETITRDQWIYSSVNAITFLAAAIFGCWLSDPLQSWLLGRRGAIFFSALLVLASAVGAACTHSWRQLFVCRLLLGLGMGAKASITVIYGSEVSPSHLRGAFLVNWQMMDALGIFFGFTANLIVSHIGHLAWRFQVASITLPTICLLTLIWATPESPRFLLKKGLLPEAYRSLLALREAPIQAARELYYANAQIQAEVSLLPKRLMKDVELAANGTEHPQLGHKPAKGRAAHHGLQYGVVRRRAVRTWHKLSRHVDDSELDEFQRHIRQTNYFTRLWQLFRDKRTRRATVAAFVVMLGQQLCGINILAIYSSNFFEEFNGGQENAASRGIWLSWGIGLANFLFTFPTYYLIDTRGRRWLLLVTYPGMCLSLLAASLSFKLPADHPSRTGVISLFIFIFVFFYSFGQGPVAFSYSAEVFPLLNREQGMSFAVFINLLFLGILTLFVPVLTTKLQYGNPSAGPGQSRLLGIFAAFNVVSFLLIFLFVPETAGATLGKEEGNANNYMSLEELNYIFGVSTIQHIRYQMRHVVPSAVAWVKYWFRKNIIRDKEAQKPEQTEDLYSWVSVEKLERLERKKSKAESERVSRRALSDANTLPEEAECVNLAEDDGRA